MKKFLKIIGGILLLLIAFVLIAGIFVSKTYHIDKSITINAPLEKVWNNINSLQSMVKWSPWLDADPNVKTSFDGQEGVIGSSYKWDGNSDVGSGIQTITKIEQPKRMDSRLHFIRPFEGNADTFVELSNDGSGTKATWSFDTKYKYPMNVMQLFINMDDMMGKQFDKGLGKLKTLSEAN